MKVCASWILLAMGTLAAVAAQARADSLSVQVLDPSGSPLRDAVVALLAANDRGIPHGAGSAIIDQIGKQFAPQVSVIATGSQVRFPNKDNVRHQVYSFSPAKVFELKLYSGTPSAPVVFDKPGLVIMGCNIHDRMLGYVYVVDTPWFGKSGGDGQVRLADLPPGGYVLQAWHPGTGSGHPALAQSVVVKGEAQLKITVDPSPAVNP